MKRFIALIIVLLVVGTIWAKKVAENKEEAESAQEETQKAEEMKALEAEKAAAEEARKLKVELKIKKGKLGKLKISIKKAKKGQKESLKEQKKAIKMSCFELKKKIRAAELQVKNMKKTYRENCWKRMQEELALAIKTTKTLKALIKKLKNKEAAVKSALKVAKKSARKPLTTQLKKLSGNLITAKSKLKEKLALIKNGQMENECVPNSFFDEWIHAQGAKE